MTITELIAKLEKMRADYGDVQVEVRRDDGYFGFVAVVEATHYAFPNAPAKWVVYLDV
jgi:hypothetical protein